jgi:hypothetical protein
MKVIRQKLGKETLTRLQAKFINLILIPFSNQVYRLKMRNERKEVYMYIVLVFTKY